MEKKMTALSAALKKEAAMELEKRGDPELNIRVRTGAVMGVIGFAVLCLSHYPYVLNITAAILSIKGISELLHAAAQDTFPKMALLSLAAVGICLWEFPHYPLVLPVVWVFAMIAFGHMMRHIGDIRFDCFAGIVLCALMLPLFFRSFAVIRQWTYGLYYLIVVIVGCAVNDVAAYFFGKAFGSHKLAPIISPGKTIEGGIGGLVCSTVLLETLSFILSRSSGVRVEYGLLMLYLILASLIGQFGDLSMSVIKRTAGIKDFGNLLPGHGGVLDRFDSLLFVAPFAVIFHQITNGFFA